MNYLQFSKKIMMYLQMGGLLFRFIVLSESDLKTIIESKAGYSFKVEVLSNSKLKATSFNASGAPLGFDIISTNSFNTQAIDGNSIVAKIENITAEGEIEYSFINAFGDISKIKDIEAKSKTLVESVIGNVITHSLSINSNTNMSVSFDSFITESMMALIEGKTDIIMAIKNCASIFSMFEAEGRFDGALLIDIIAGMLAKFSIESEAIIDAEIKNARGINSRLDVFSFATLSSIIKLLIEATIGDYENYTLSEMGDNTIGELSQILI